MVKNDDDLPLLERPHISSERTSRAMDSVLGLPSRTTASNDRESESYFVNGSTRYYGEYLTHDPR